jgi:hypothetical protein
MQLNIYVLRVVQIAQQIVPHGAEFIFKLGAHDYMYNVCYKKHLDVYACVIFV